MNRTAALAILALATVPGCTAAVDLKRSGSVIESINMAETAAVCSRAARVVTSTNVLPIFRQIGNLCRNAGHL